MLLLSKYKESVIFVVAAFPKLENVIAKGTTNDKIWNVTIKENYASLPTFR